MRFRDGTHVFTSDEKDMGVIARVVLDSQSKVVTHIVIRQGLLFSEDTMIPVELLTQENEGRVVLRQPQAQMPDFLPFAEQNLPDKAVGLEIGAAVITRDDEHVGDVSLVFVDPTSKQATQVVISKGWLFKERKLVPTAWIHRLVDGKVYLAVSKPHIDQLESFES